jgi:hypothetical protein
MANDFSETAIKRIESALGDALEEIGFSSEDFMIDEMRVLALAAIEAVTKECGRCDPELYSND